MAVHVVIRTLCTRAQVFMTSRQMVVVHGVQQWLRLDYLLALIID